MQTEISHTRHKVFITCLESDKTKMPHVIELWKKQAASLIESTFGLFKDKEPNLDFGMYTKK